MSKIKNTFTHIRRKLGMDKDENEKLNRIRADFKKRTENVNDDFIDLGDFLMLLDLAEYGHLGKTSSIIYAMKIGYLLGLTAHEKAVRA